MLFSIIKSIEYIFLAIYVFHTRHKSLFLCLLYKAYITTFMPSIGGTIIFLSKLRCIREYPNAKLRICFVIPLTCSNFADGFQNES